MRQWTDVVRTCGRDAPALDKILTARRIDIFPFNVSRFHDTVTNGHYCFPEPSIDEMIRDSLAGCLGSSQDMCFEAVNEEMNTTALSSEWPGLSMLVLGSFSSSAEDWRITPLSKYSHAWLWVNCCSGAGYAYCRYMMLGD